MRTDTLFLLLTGFLPSLSLGTFLISFCYSHVPLKPPLLFSLPTALLVLALPELAGSIGGGGGGWSAPTV